jgi:Mg-chelatase subunit ChlD
LNIQTDRRYIPAGSPAERYLAITVTAPSRERQTDRPSVNVALVLDRSGSMGGRKFEMARQAVDHAIKLLQERDRLAVVCYDDHIDTLLGATSATPEARALALERLRAIDARGSTDLCGGWLRGAGEIAPPAQQGLLADEAIRRVLLLTDGLANRGEQNPDALARHAADLRARGVATSTFGLGADFDETLLSRLATDGGGHFYFIEQPAQIADFLTSELGETLDVVARDVRLIFGGESDVKVRCLSDFVTQQQTATSGEAETHVRLGDLVSGQQVTVLVAVQCPARELNKHAVVTVRLADRERVFFPQSMIVDWQAVGADGNAGQRVNEEVLVQVARVVASKARLAALDANRRGAVVAATGIIKDAVVWLRDLAPGIEAVQRLAAELDAELQDFEVAMQPMALKARYFESHNVAYSRETTGKARRSP